MNVPSQVLPGLWQIGHRLIQQVCPHAQDIILDVLIPIHLAAVEEELLLVVFRHSGKECLGPIVLELPPFRSVILQDLQTHGHLLLGTYHAGEGEKKTSLSITQISNIGSTTLHLQRLFAEDEQQEVDKVGGQIVEEDDAEHVHQVAALDGAVGIPQRVGEGVFVELLLALLNALAPRHGVLRGGGHIGVQNLRGSKLDRGYKLINYSPQPLHDLHTIQLTWKFPVPIQRRLSYSLPDRLG